MRSYGARVWTFWQDLSQLAAIYPDFHSLINNSATLQQFGVPSPFAAKTLDEFYAGYLLKPVYDIAPRELVLTRTGSKPQIMIRPSYLADPLFAGLYDRNPFYRERPPSLLEASNVRRLNPQYELFGTARRREC